MKCDFLIIGSGIAGLSFALRVADLGTVCIVTKKKDVDTATNLAQGGIAAVLDEDDDFSYHIEDTLKSGAGLCSYETVKTVVEEGPERIKDLIDIGVNFVESRDNPGKLNLGREGGHSKRRVAHSFDLTGRAIEEALLETIKRKPSVIVEENSVCVDLILDKNKSVSNEKEKCVGAYVLKDEKIEVYEAGVTVLCTGGAGKVYLYTSNPDIASGDGVAMALRAGAEVANMEFVQFHPTCLYHPQAKNFLITEAVRGEGGILLNSSGERFMEKYAPNRKELATRDMVARSIDKEMKISGCDCVYLDISHKDSDFVRNRFPGVYSKCKELGIDITSKPIPVVPAAHYMCGGVLTDYWGRTSVDNLFCLGETACTGLHGANRLASNSLLEAVVYAHRSATFCRENRKLWKNYKHGSIDNWVDDGAVFLDEEILINHNWDLIRRIMWNYVGIVRNEKRLKLASQQLSEIVKEIESHYHNYHISTGLIELRNIAIIANLIVESAKYRKESRGLHFLEDCPGESESDRHWNVFRRISDGNSYPWQVEKIREISVKKIDIE
ncbi:L-aspartate oxidase [Desulfopila sp. IMCC35008]|uniref:L-aspartate oxidase n=1 Tax=Desulfopila sp. IMCC35008 TaxID=2653858 RepID=UPI0013D1597F|nr:L-aspartate oxidase [Desulfopila sp. IMCC35008]